MGEILRNNRRMFWEILNRIIGIKINIAHAQITPVMLSYACADHTSYVTHMHIAQWIAVILPFIYILSKHTAVKTPHVLVMCAHAQDFNA